MRKQDIAARVSCDGGRRRPDVTWTRAEGNLRGKVAALYTSSPLEGRRDKEAVGDCAGYKSIDGCASSESEYGRSRTPTALCSAERNAGDEEINACEREYFAS